jgi:hypothetical protein
MGQYGLGDCGAIWLRNDAIGSGDFGAIWLRGVWGNITYEIMGQCYYLGDGGAVWLWEMRAM